MKLLVALCDVADEGRQCRADVGDGIHVINRRCNKVALGHSKVEFTERVLLALKRAVVERQRASSMDEVESTREQKPRPGSFKNPRAILLESAFFKVVVHWHGTCDCSLCNQAMWPMEQLGPKSSSNERSGLFFNGVA